MLIHATESERVGADWIQLAHEGRHSDSWVALMAATEGGGGGGGNLGRGSVVFW
jgi:hypothetical protein